MRDLYERIRRAVHEERVVFTAHADDQLLARRMERWQLLESFDEGELVKMRPKAIPNPAILVRQLLPDGIAVVAVWSYVKSANYAKLVTAYFEE